MQNYVGAQRRMLEHQSTAVTPNYIKKAKAIFKAFTQIWKEEGSSSTPVNSLTTKEAPKNIFSADDLLGTNMLTNYKFTGVGDPLKLNQTYSAVVYDPRHNSFGSF